MAKLCQVDEVKNRDEAIKRVNEKMLISDDRNNKPVERRCQLIPPADRRRNKQILKILIDLIESNVSLL